LVKEYLDILKMSKKIIFITKKESKI